MPRNQIVTKELKMQSTWVQLKIDTVIGHFIELDKFSSQI